MRHQRALLGLSISTLLLSATTGISTAQEAPQEGEARVKEIIVTGSRIARRDFESNRPIVTVSLAELERGGDVFLEMTLQQQPQFSPDMNATTPLLRDGGRAQNNSRALGANRNLVLLEGRRMISSDLGGSIDLNTIPSTLVESIEVISGGASAIYGSDAISGVVNFKLKSDFEGVEFDAQYGQSFRGDAAQRQFGISTGPNFADNRGNAVNHLNYTKRDAILQQRRSFSTTPQW